MRALKILGIALCVYVGIVIAFESLIGFFQPAGESTLVITTTDAGGTSSDRVLARLESAGQLYVAANHWPRSWYQDALKNPDVQITFAGQKQPYRAVPATADEHERVNTENEAGIVFKILTGFPPRKFLRLEPQPDAAP